MCSSYNTERYIVIIGFTGWNVWKDCGLRTISSPPPTNSVYKGTQLNLGLLLSTFKKMFIFCFLSKEPENFDLFLFRYFFFYLCVNVCKHNLLSLLVLLRGIWFQGWPLCIGYPIRGLILGRDWFSLSAVCPLVVGCPELSSFLVAGTCLLVLSLFRFCLGSHNVIMGAALLSFLVIILIKAFPRL